MREKRRDKAFAADTSIYNARMESYIATKTNADEFGSRFRLFNAVDGLMSRLARIDLYFGETILNGDILSPDFDKSERFRVLDDYGLWDLYWCASHLTAFAQLASLEFV